MKTGDHFNTAIQETIGQRPREEKEELMPFLVSGNMSEVPFFIQIYSRYCNVATCYDLKFGKRCFLECIFLTNNVNMIGE